MNQTRFCTNSRLLAQKTALSVLKVLLFQFFLLVQTAVKLRNSQIHENCQLRYVLNYSNLFYVFLHIFGKHITRKIFPKFIDPVTSMGWVKNALDKCFFFF